MNSDTDYRKSHTAKGFGADYHKRFEDSPYRKYIWDIEQNLLIGLIEKYYDGKVDNYLDFACGTGRIITLLEKYTKKAIGLDVSDSMLEVAKKQIKTAKLIKGDITSEKVLSDSKFKLITAFRFFLNAQPDLRSAVMNKLSEHLDTEGYLIFNIHNNTSGLTNQISKVYTTIKYRKRIPNKEMSVTEVKELLDQNGLKIVEMIPYGTFPIFKEEKKFPETLVKIVDKYFTNTTLSTYIIYVCQAK